MEIKNLLVCALSIGLVVANAPASGVGIGRIVSRDFDICEQSHGASKFCLSQYVDYDAGSFEYHGISVGIYIGNHPDAKSLGKISEPDSESLVTLYAGARKGHDTYVMIYGFIDEKKFGNQVVRIPTYVMLDVKDNAAGRAAIRLIGSNLVRCTKRR